MIVIPRLIDYYRHMYDFTNYVCVQGLGLLTSVLITEAATQWNWLWGQRDSQTLSVTHSKGKLLADG